jgi:hypothetical protein
MKSTRNEGSANRVIRLVVHHLEEVMGTTRRARSAAGCNAFDVSSQSLTEAATLLHPAEVVFKTWRALRSAALKQS